MLIPATAKNAPPGSALHIFNTVPKAPWWKDYFGVSDAIRQSLAGSIMFVPAKGRHFAITFGHVQHNLEEESYEYDFGLLVTLNSLKPDQVKSADTLQPVGARRQRVQMNKRSALAQFQIDMDETVVKSITGKADDAYQNFFKNATGSSSVRISSPLPADKLTSLCEKLLEIYLNKAYLNTFPDLQNITPVTDPVKLLSLQTNLLKAVVAKDPDVQLSIPEIVDYHSDQNWANFRGAGTGEVFNEASIETYYEYLRHRGIDLKKLDLAHLKRHHVLLTAEDGTPSGGSSHSIYKCLVFEFVDPIRNEAFHLCEGHWYAIGANLIASLKADLDPLFTITGLPSFNHDSEEEFNTDVGSGNPTFCTLDRKNISLKGQKQVEPCDLLKTDGKAVTFHHVKISDSSAPLSHLFSQGLNAIRLLKDDAAAVQRLETLVSSQVSPPADDSFNKPIRDGNWRLAYDIVTRKNPALKSDNLPIFSRLTFKTVKRECRRMGVPLTISFIPNISTPKSKKKKRKSNSSSASP